MFQTCGIDELWLNIWVGQPPALWNSEMAQMATRNFHHADGRHHDARPVPAPALDLLDGQISSQLVRVGRCLRLDVRGPLLHRRLHLDLLSTQPSTAGKPASAG